MKLKDYKPEDAAVICSWIKTEKELYLWSAEGHISTGIHPPGYCGCRFSGI